MGGPAANLHNEQWVFKLCYIKVKERQLVSLHILEEPLPTCAGIWLVHWCTFSALLLPIVKSNEIHINSLRRLRALMHFQHATNTGATSINLIHSVKTCCNQYPCSSFTVIFYHSLCIFLNDADVYWSLVQSKEETADALWGVTGNAPFSWTSIALFGVN